MVDIIVGNDSVCSSDAPKAKTAKNEEVSTATDNCDLEMRVVDSERQQKQMSTTKEHGISGSEYWFI